MVDFEAAREILQAINKASPFNRSSGFELVEIGPGLAKLAMKSSGHVLNQLGTVHAGVQTGLLETAAAFAAGLAAERQVVTIQMSLSFLAQAAGERLVATARVSRASRSHVFVEAEMTAEQATEAKVVTSATLVLKSLG